MLYSLQLFVKVFKRLAPVSRLALVVCCCLVLSDASIARKHNHQTPVQNSIKRNSNALSCFSTTKYGFNSADVEKFEPKCLRVNIWHTWHQLRVS